MYILTYRTYTHPYWPTPIIKKYAYIHTHRSTDVITVYHTDTKHGSLGGATDPQWQQMSRLFAIKEVLVLRYGHRAPTPILHYNSIQYDIINNL